ncbi:phage tail protein [Achromobacter xylosoxidans]|uniref:phage tail protein n=1 Tax=Alcaligenes xylosoxydans xylosoxydans TaxID=85698 RepID=UPI0012A7DE94|nr:phage tail protein [Achromobacter xylosoxidans]CUR80000.1 Phage Tail Collar Domain protein [Achromobacter xylosoxidans]
MTTYFGILTKIGEAKEANAKALGVPVKIAEMEVGDGGGALPVPDREQTSLIGSKHRAPINRIFVDPSNPAWLVVEQVIPEQFGGWWARELGLRDADGDLIAVSNCPPTYKPQMAEGSARTQVVRMVLQVSSTANFTLKIDPAVVLATREYVDLEASKKLGKMETAVAAKKLAQPVEISITGSTSGKASFDGQEAVSITTKSNIEVVMTGAVSGTAKPSPDTHRVSIDTKSNLEIALTGAITGTAKADPNTHRITIDTRANSDNVAMLAQFATLGTPDGWLHANGAAVSRTAYARLFAVLGVYFGGGDGSTTFNLPDLRGMFLRGLDSGRGLDAGRTIGQVQYSANQWHTHGVSDPGHHHGIAYQFPANMVDTDRGNTPSDFSIDTPVQIATQVAYTGIGINGAGEGEARPINVAFPIFIKY